ncbi:MAG TPA: 5-methyltetrahydropteroyltriglutamate--homocysteine S-methyltransferase [Candidatus Acidoferrales bacterium]|jgi:5-methyltetrahydropteroyltriglutamate--homocysteine methyltransferase|nr:5-methyltetrahydropteroyltriglutamate--homocysteine S-methyltransferase [Candidatus Acidoferrales bacterium]
MPAIYRAEQVGSLLRPPELLKARAAHARGQLSVEKLRDEEDRAIAAALEKQRQLGIDILSDGEFRRGSWLTDMADAVEGFVPDNVQLDWKGPGGGSEGSTANVAGAKLRKHRKMTGYELPFLKKSAAGRPFKITLPAPSNFTLASYKKGISDRFYPTHADLLRDLVDIVRDDIRWLVSEGVRYIQLDAPYYSHYIDPHDRENMRQRGFDPDEEFDKAIAGDNEALQEIPRDTVTRAFHVCRGNSRSRWYAEGGYDAIAEKLFGSLDADTFLLEYDTDRAGGFEPLRLVPRGKIVVLGLITTKDAKLESQDALIRRIEEASKYVPLENLALSPQCGFASVAAGNLLSMDDQWRKLELVVNTARRVWG